VQSACTTSVYYGSIITFIQLQKHTALPCLAAPAQPRDLRA
jgi:hypothetical protein